MNYCSIGHDSDVKCYQPFEGCWTIIVAKHRSVSDVPFPEPDSADHTDIDYIKSVVKWYRNAKYEEIELPYAGCWFQLMNPGECVYMLEELRSDGYIIPQHAIDKLNEESNPSLTVG